jgi:integrase
MASIRKRYVKTGRTKKDRERWDVEFYDAKGKHKRTFHTKDEADGFGAEADLERIRSARTWRTPERVPVCDAALAWYEERALNTPQPTLWTDKAAVFNYIIPHFGSRLAISITPLDVVKWEDEVATGAYTRNGKPPAAGTIQNYRTRLGMIFDRLVLDGLPRNPVRGVPRRTRRVGQPPAPKPLLSLAGFESLLRAAAQSNFDRASVGQLRREILWIGCEGTRITETFELRWSDVDFELRRVWVHGTKTEASDDWIPILKPAFKVLRAQQLACRFTEQDDYIFPAITGRRQSTQWWRAGYFNPVRDAAGLPKTFSPRVLRNMAVTVARGMQADADVIRRLARHTNLDMTSHYSRGLEEWVQAAADLDHPFSALGDV